MKKERVIPSSTRKEKQEIGFLNGSKMELKYKNLSQQVHNGNSMKPKYGSGRQPLFHELENIVCEWIDDRRAKGLVIHRADIQAFDITMASQSDTSLEKL